MDYQLTYEEEYEFNDLVKISKNSINLAMYKCNIKYKDYDEFYSYALEGLLVSFLILKRGDVEEKDFARFSFITMKRKIIDELRRRNRGKFICCEDIENQKVFSDLEKDIYKIEIENNLKNSLSSVEYAMFKMLEEGIDNKIIFSKLNISKSQGYNLIKNIKENYTSLLYNL